MIELIGFSVALIAITIAVGQSVDAWLKEDVRKQLSSTLRSQFHKGPTEWFHSVETAFSTLFDYVYGWRTSQLNRILWRAILFSYVMLFMARVVLWVFNIPVPQMEKILVIAFVVAVGVVTLLQIDIPALHLKEGPDAPPLRQLIRERRFCQTAIVSALFVAYYTFAAIFTGHGVGISLKTVSAIAVGAAIGVPAVILISRVKDSLFGVAPIPAMVSTLVFLAVLAIKFRTPAATFLTEFNRTGPLIMATVAFNIFGDALSLVETRWLLRLSRGLSMLGIIGMLVLDLILSAFLYLLLPGIAGIHWSDLLLAAQFQGPHPWMGILFWGTFFTSLLFYLFVASMLLVRVVLPGFRVLNRIERWFDIDQHPMSFITTAMVVVEAGVFLVWIIIRLWQ
jgi:hypothetical protein